MQDMIYSIKLSLQDPQCRKLFESTINADGVFKVLNPKSPQHPDLLVYELRTNPIEELSRIEELLSAGKLKDVFIYSPVKDPDVLLKIIKMGLKEFFAQPLEEQDIIASLDGFKERMQTSSKTPERKQGRIFNVIGSKGGVGTTTIAVNLASALIQQKPSPSVVLLDMNTLFGDIPLFLDIQSKFHWGEITKNIDRLDDTFLMNVLDKHPTGIHVLTSPGYLNGHIEPTPEMMERLLTQMQSMFDFIIVDAGQSTKDTSLKVTQMAEAVLLISTLNLPCLSNTSKLVQSYLNMGYATRDRIKIVINRYLKKGEISLQDAEKGIKQELFWVVPNDYETTMSAINHGKSLLAQHPKSPIAKSFRDMAGAFVETSASKKKSRKWLFF
jgi:pilus assembly protein CpaE